METEKTDVEGSSEFNNAFDLAEGKPPEKEPELEKEPDKEVTPPAEEIEKPPEKPPEKEKNEDQTNEQRYRTLQGIYKHDKTAWESEKATLLAQIEEAKKAGPAAVIPPPEVKEKEKQSLESFLDSLTPEQKAELDEYEKDFDIVSKMEGLKREREMAKLKKEFEEKVKSLRDEISAQLTPTENFVKEVSQEREIRSKEDHFNAIAEAHSDFEKYRDDGSILKWIETKPKYQQKGMIEAYNTGDAEDVIELLDDFKKENNIGAPEENAQVVNLAKKRAEKREALTSVTTRRGAVNTGMAAHNDFESAFEEALNK